MPETQIIELSPTCKIVHYTWENIPGSVELEYVEHATDHWHHDRDTSVAISEKDAENIIAFLRNAFPNLK
jgi:hypothetical protein